MWKDALMHNMHRIQKIKKGYPRMNVEELKSQMHEFFMEKKNQTREKAKSLQADGEEALACLELEKIGVYDAFGTIMEASALEAETNPKYADMDKGKAFSQEYLMAFICKPSEWRMRYAAATGMEDWEQMTIGEIRLATVQEIKDEFLRLTKQA